jgi:hypothetical protein
LVTSGGVGGVFTHRHFGTKGAKNGKMDKTDIPIAEFERVFGDGFNYHFRRIQADDTKYGIPDVAALSQLEGVLIADDWESSGMEADLKRRA